MDEIPFLDYIMALEDRGTLIKTAKELPFLVKFMEDHHKFETAKKTQSWIERFNAHVAAEFDESCFPVDFSKVAEPPSMIDTIQYMDSFTREVGPPWGVETPEEPDGWWSHVRPDMLCEVCGHGGDTPEHFYACEYNGHLGENL